MRIMAAKAVAVLHRSMGMHPGELLLFLLMAPVAQTWSGLFQHARNRRCMIRVTLKAFSLSDRLVGNFELSFFRLMPIELPRILAGIMALEVTVMALAAKICLPPALRPFHLAGMRVVADAALFPLQGLMDDCLSCLLQYLLVTLIATLRFPDR